MKLREKFDIDRECRYAASGRSQDQVSQIIQSPLAGWAYQGERVAGEFENWRGGKYSGAQIHGSYKSKRTLMRCGKRVRWEEWKADKSDGLVVAEDDRRLRFGSSGWQHVTLGPLPPL